MRASHIGYVGALAGLPAPHGGEHGQPVRVRGLAGRDEVSTHQRHVVCKQGTFRGAIASQRDQQVQRKCGMVQGRATTWGWLCVRRREII